MGKTLTPEKQKLIEELFYGGATIYRASRIVGVTEQTIKRYYDKLGDPEKSDTAKTAQRLLCIKDFRDYKAA